MALSCPVHGFKEFCSLFLIGSKIDPAAGTLCITVLTNTETIISSNMICISAVHIIFIIVQSTVSKADTFGTGTSCPS